MEAKDTVKTNMELLTNDDWDEGGGYIHESVDKALAIQAKITWDMARKAGIREVVDKIVKMKGCYDTQGNLIGILSWDKKEWESIVGEWLGENK
jgi:hypothetical protein